MSNGWILARTKPKQELWAAENVENQGYRWYLPRTLVHHRNFSRAEPLFHCYLFVQTSGAWHFLLSTFGVTSVVTFGNSPSLVPDIEVQKLKDRELNGLVQLDKAPDKRARFALGATVRVKGGVFSGYTGVYQGMDAREREKVLFDFLGRKVPTLLATEFLEEVA